MLPPFFSREFPSNYFAAQIEIVQSVSEMLCSQRLKEIAKGRAEGRPTPIALNGVLAGKDAGRVPGACETTLKTD